MSIVRWSPPGAEDLALVCLPWAGAGAAPFRGWAASLAGTAAVYGIRLAGRESRLAQAPSTSLAEVVDEVLADVHAVPERRVALFGLCSGALTALEVARSLSRRTSPPRLAHLLIASQIAPGLIASRDGGAPPTDQELLERYVDEDLRSEPELVELLLPVLAADMRAVTTYTYEIAPPLDAPLTVFRGGADDAVPAADVDGWRDETAGPSAFVELAGADHLFRGASWPALADAVRHALSG